MLIILPPPFAANKTLYCSLSGRSSIFAVLITDTSLTLSLSLYRLPVVRNPQSPGHTQSFFFFFRDVCFYFIYSFIFWLRPWHRQVPWPGIKSFTTGTAAVRFLTPVSQRELQRFLIWTGHANFQLEPLDFKERTFSSRKNLLKRVLCYSQGRHIETQSSHYSSK